MESLNLYKFKKGDLLQKDTSPTVYEVLRDETKTGYVTVTSEGVKYRFNSNLQALTPYTEEGK